MQNWTSKNYHKNDKIYRGSFNYYRNENIYAEESFDVYRDKKENTFSYVSECLSRVATGEILTTRVEYIVNKEYIPVYVCIEKLMGKEWARELFEYNQKRGTIQYSFNNSKNEEHKEEMSTAPKFHIACPTSATSILFLRSKKFDAQGKNYYHVLTSFNQWEFKETPKFVGVLLDRPTLTAEKLNIEGQNVQATQYRLFDENVDSKSAKEPPHIKCFVSPHGGIPYLLRGDDGTKIQIKFLNDMSEKD